tara:strand:- start:1022 stop:1291 length:270 start_codon:yes stop_codon:yes gene_type:complete
MSRTLVKGNEIVLPTSAGAGTSFSEATVVRLYNSDSNSHVVTVQESAGGTGVGSFTMPAGHVEFLEKNPTYTVFSDSATVLGAKVGFTA